jgi:hypothetical protein
MSTELVSDLDWTGKLNDFIDQDGVLREHMWQLCLFKHSALIRQYRYNREIKLNKDDWQEILKLIRMENHIKLIPEEERQQLDFVQTLRQRIEQEFPNPIGARPGCHFWLYVDLYHSTEENRITKQDTINLNIQYRQVQNPACSQSIKSTYSEVWVVDIHLFPDSSHAFQCVESKTLQDMSVECVQYFWKGFQDPVVQHQFRNWDVSSIWNESKETSITLPLLNKDPTLNECPLILRSQIETLYKPSVPELPKPPRGKKVSTRKVVIEQKSPLVTANPFEELLNCND